MIYRKDGAEILSWYDGELDVAYQGKRHHLRFAAFAHSKPLYNPGVWESDILPAVGTIYCGTEFPTPEAVKAIKALLAEGHTVDFQSFVPARWNDDEKRIERQEV